MKTLAAMSLGDELIARSADVCLKEGRKLMFVVRKTPLNDIHLEDMWVKNHLSVLSKALNLDLAYRLLLRRAGAIKLPSVPAYYMRPQTIDHLTNQTMGRILDSSECSVSSS